MRLGQLARKLAVRNTEIVEFLASRAIRIDEGSNTRVEDSYVTMIVQHFAPEQAAEWTVEPELKQEDNQPVIANETAVIESRQDLNPDALTEPPADPGQPKDEKIEVIKAPKVELSGLKVLGKIDLPDIKKKEPKETIEQESTASEKSKEGQRDYTSKRQALDKPRKNPIAIQREREARETKEKQLEEAKREKERRTQFYRNRFRTAPPVKAVKIVKEEVEEMTPIEEIPKTWFGRFLKWLTT